MLYKTDGVVSTPRAMIRLSVKALVFIALAGALLSGLGPLLASVRALSPLAGFSILMLGLLLAALALVLTPLVMLRIRRSSTRLERRGVLFAGGVSIVTLLLVIAPVGRGLLAPPINDITTDFEDAPEFSALARTEANYPDDFAAVQRQFYPDLAPLVTELPPAAALARARHVAERLGWTVVTSDRAALRFEATDQTPVFHFIDDVVVRVRPRAGGSRVDVRSKSREGKGDLGTNAWRIRAFLRAMRQP